MHRGDPDAFARRLERLKAAGSTQLVLGMDARARSAVSAQLIGAPAAGRRALFVLLGRDRAVVENRLPEGLSADDTRIVEYDFYRSAARSTEARDHSTARRLDDLEAVFDEVRQAMAAVSSETDDQLAPGELRVCVDSLAPIVDGFDRPAVVGFLENLGSEVRSHRGMAHAVLPVPELSDGFDWLGSAFDAIVEARRVEGNVQERWLIPDDGLTTEWFSAHEVAAG